MALCKIPDTGGIDYNLLSSIVHNCVQEDKLSKLRATLSKRTREQRRQIVNQKVNGNTPLFTACQQGKEEQTRHEVTPLWCAAVANKLDIVQTLVRHGANLNTPSDTESTPIRSACFMTNIPVIKFLVEHGADIHKPNVNGGTCLINAVQSAHLCMFLINKGADVNAVDNSKNTALHYAIREGVVESVKVLLKRKANPSMKNDMGDDALQSAASRGNVEIIDIIASMVGMRLEDKINAYELAGACHLDEKNDMASALKLWRKAMEMRYSDKNSLVLKVLPSEKKKVYNFAKEPENMKELEALADPEEIYMQTLLIRERILGPNHKDAVFGLMYRGAVYADSHRYQRCADLWKYAYTLRYKQDEPLNHDCLFTVQALVKFFWEVQMEQDNNNTDEKIQFYDALDVIEILTDQILAAKDYVAKSATKSEDQNTLSEFQLLLQLYLHMIHLFTRLECNQEEKYKFMTFVHRMVQEDPHCGNGQTLLHLAVDPMISLTGDEFYSNFPSLDVIQVLVTCGARVNAQCEKGNTPLLDCAKRHFEVGTRFDDNEISIIQFLINVGSHVDIMNEEGLTANRFLAKSTELSHSSMKYLSLKCLASTEIMKQGIPFENEIPFSLSTKVEHVSLHMPQKERDLHLAVMANDRDGVRSLIRADINYPWSNPAVPSVKDSTTPLLAAVSLNHVEISMAGADINMTDRNGCTPLYKAAYHGRPVLVDILTNHDKDGQTPLYICVQNAVIHSSYATVEMLLAAGANVHQSDRNGKSPIHVAAHWKIKDMIRILAGPTMVNRIDNMGRTPLYVCVSSLSCGLYKEDLKYQVPCIKLLFHANCDMLNLMDWLKMKGPGIPPELLANDEEFFDWYTKSFNSSHSLKNLCRKVIQQRMIEATKDNFLKKIQYLPLPSKLHVYLSRKMFLIPTPTVLHNEI
ncbi:FEM1C-like protein [Mya arenaria]|uniref:FEM1C-like protein n=1 Tax=Mya arenaria TaxID=6604 RepID=A0ABY7FKC0_MYAAR|nr:FEM1C-like protein [Mya arenaria]